MSFFSTDVVLHSPNNLCSPLVPALKSLPEARATATRAQKLRSAFVLLLAPIRLEGDPRAGARDTYNEFVADSAYKSGR